MIEVQDYRHSACLSHRPNRGWKPNPTRVLQRARCRGNHHGAILSFGSRNASLDKLEIDAVERAHGVTVGSGRDQNVVGGDKWHEFPPG